MSTIRQSLFSLKRLWDHDSHNRAVSTTLGTVLIFSLITFSVFSIATIGIASVEELQTNSERESATEAMTQLDSQMSLVAFDGSDQTTIDLSTGSDEQIDVREGGQMTIELIDSNGEVNNTILDTEMGKIVYQMDDYHVAYQGGGVWEYDESEQNSRFVSPPEYSVSNTTTTLPVILIDADNTHVDGSQITLQKGGSETHHPVSGVDGLSNPVMGDDIQVTIQSQYYEAWGDYFESRTDVENVEYDHENNTMRLGLVTEDPEGVTVETGIEATGSDSSITVRGSGGPGSTFVDSYNSSVGPYNDPSQNHDQGFIRSQGGIDLSSQAELRGDAATDGDLRMGGQATVTNDAYVDGDVFTGGGSSVQGEIRDPLPTASETPRANGEISFQRQELKDSNDNDQIAAIDGDNESSTLDTSSTPTIESGEYIISELDVSGGDQVEFDLSDGDITLVVDGDISVSGDVTVVGNENNDNRLLIYTTGDSITYDGGTHTVEGDDSLASWIYSGEGTAIQITNHASKTGVIYAAGTDSSAGTVEVSTHSSLYGGVVGGETEVQAHSVVHYDEVLSGEEVFVGGSQNVEVLSSKLVYLQVSTTTIEVSD